MSVSPNKNNENIKLRPHVIICEGTDDQGFLIRYLNYHIGEGNLPDDTFRVEKADGVNNIPRAFGQIIQESSFKKNGKSVIIIRDADNNAQAASEWVKKIFKDNGFVAPTKPCAVTSSEINGQTIKTAYALFPSFNSETENGMLEDLCLDILESKKHEYKDDVLHIADNAIVQAKEVTPNPINENHISKNKLHTYFSLNDDFVGKTIGTSAEEDAFDFNSPKLEPLKILFGNMIKEPIATATK